MDYKEFQNEINKKASLGIKPGLVRIKNLLNKLDNPQDKIQIIHVSGTNGKGTIAGSISQSLQEAGYKVGLFTSPWISEYEEQIQINSSKISKADIIKYFNICNDDYCTEFEVLTAIMYKYFYDNNVDYAVIECGMGGLNDSTNVESKNAISVITSISLDHTEYFGNSIEKIAEEKVGIIRQNSICVLYPNPSIKEIVKTTCRNNNVKFIEVHDAGSIEENNINTVKAVLNELDDTIEVKMVKPFGRVQIINDLVIDGSHNIEACKNLVDILEGEKYHILISMMKDKDIDSYLKMISNICDDLIICDIGSARTIDIDELYQIASTYIEDITIVKNPNEAFEVLMSKEGNKLICGSFYLLRKLYKKIKQVI